MLLNAGNFRVRIIWCKLKLIQPLGHYYILPFISMSKNQDHWPFEALSGLKSHTISNFGLKPVPKQKLMHYAIGGTT